MTLDMTMKYHKINSIYKRDMTKRHAPFLIGEWAEPEFDYLQNNQWEFTEKIDGTNIRVMFDGENIVFGGKTDDAQISSHLFDKLQKLFLPRKMELKEIFKSDGEPVNVCLYGEGFGHKIQGKVGTDYLSAEVDFCLFDVRVGNWWLERKNIYDIAGKLGLKTPKIVGHGTLPEAIELVKIGFKSGFGTAQGEGLVLRPVVELKNRGGQRIITKVKTIDFKQLNNPT